MKVAFLGLTGSNSHLAAQKYLSDNATPLGLTSFSKIFSEVSLGFADVGILPLENSLTGSIYEIYDLLIKNDLDIIGELFLKINHNLLVKSDFLNKKLSIQDITICYSHPEVFKQCRLFLDKHSNIKTVLSSDTSEAARIVSKQKNITTSVIGNNNLTSIYNLKIIKRNIGDHNNNYTRFIAIGKKGTKSGNKVSIIFSVEHKPGSLIATLVPYAKFGLNLTKIESRPVIGKPWEYTFFVDFELGEDKKILTNVLEEMKKHVKFLKVVGLYEKGKTYES